MGAICVTMLPIAVLKLILLHFYWQPHLLKKNLGFENSEILKCVPESVHIFHWILRHVRKYIWIFSNPEFVLYCSWRLKTLTVTHLGKLSPSKTDEFSEKFQTVFDPPPLIFRKIILRILGQKCICSLWWDCCVSYDPISDEMHVVQQFNMLIG